ncbi:MAG: tryptophan-rich sensory protein [Pyrinomonadaceae bacterium]
MTENEKRVDGLRSILVAAATIGVIAFNWLAAVGRINGVTPEVISDKYPTPITPAGYAFAIWSLIYVGLIAFSVYQMLPRFSPRLRGIRSFYILSCALNCGWIYMWHHDQIAICLVIIIFLWATLLLINLHLKHTEGPGEYWLVKAPFSIYFGWVTAATLVNFAILLVSLDVSLTPTSWSVVGIGLILFAGALGILIRIRLNNYLYPLAIAWAVAAIGVKQSGQTLIVVACAVALIACLIATLSFVVNLPSSSDARNE